MRTQQQGVDVGKKSVLTKDVMEMDQHEAEAREAGAGRPRTTPAIAIHRAIATTWRNWWGCLRVASISATARSPAMIRIVMGVKD